MNTPEGRILPILANAMAASRHAPEWGGVLAFNEFGCGTVVLKPTPWGVVPKGEWTDYEDRLAAEWLQHQGILEFWCRLRLPGKQCKPLRGTVHFTR